MRFTLTYVAVHLPRLCGPLSFIKIVEKKTIKNSQKNSGEKVYVRQKEIMKFYLTACCSAVFRLKQCVLLSDERSTRLVNARKKLISIKKTTSTHEVHFW